MNHKKYSCVCCFCPNPFLLLSQSLSAFSPPAYSSPCLFFRLIIRFEVIIKNIFSTLFSLFPPPPFFFQPIFLSLFGRGHVFLFFVCVYLLIFLIYISFTFFFLIVFFYFFFFILMALHYKILVFTHPICLARFVVSII